LSKRTIKRLNESDVINLKEFHPFKHDLIEILSAKPKKIADGMKSRDNHLVFLQNLYDELARHVPVNFLHFDKSFIRVSGRKILIPSDITLEEAETVIKKVEKIVATNFGQKIFDMTLEKLSKAGLHMDV